MKTDITDLRAQIIEEARSRLATPPGEDEVTVSMMAKELGCPHKSAYNVLANMVNEGRATVRTTGPGRQNVYKLKK